jgi:hypothetical protein
MVCTYTGCKLSARSLLVAANDLAKFLRLKFGSLGAAFDLDGHDRRQREDELRKLFSTLFVELLVDADQVSIFRISISDVKFSDKFYPR